MTGNKKRLRSAFRFAWTAYRKHPFLFIALLAGIAGSWMLLEVLVIGIQAAPLRPVHVALHLGYFWVSSLFEATLFKVTLDLCDERQPRPLEKLRDFKGALQFTMTKLVFAVAVLVGFALLLLPGLWLSGRWGFAFFASAEGDSWSGALRSSARLTAPIQLQAMRYAGLILLLNVLGAALYGFGLLVTVPVSILLGASLYRSLSADADT